MPQDNTQLPWWASGEETIGLPRAPYRKPIYDVGSPLDTWLKSLGGGLKEAAGAPLRGLRRLTTAPAQMAPLRYKEDMNIPDLPVTPSAGTGMGMPATPQNLFGPRGFRPVGQDAYEVQADSDPTRAAGVMTRTPGGVGMGGQDWTQRALGALQGAAPAPYRPTEEELYKRAFPMARPEDPSAPYVTLGNQPQAAQTLQARLGGFETPAEAAGYGRQFEMAKEEIPVRQQAVASQGALDVAREQQRGALDVAQTGADFLSQLAQTGQLPRSVNVRGIGGMSFAPEQRAPASTVNQLIDAKAAWEAALQRGGAMLGLGSNRDIAPAEAAYRQALGGVYAQDPSSAQPELQEMAMFIATHPRLHNVPLLQAITSPEVNEEYDASALDEEEIDTLNRLLNYGRGAF